MKKLSVAIFASGTGSNTINLIQSFKDNEGVSFSFVLSNKEDAPVVSSARAQGLSVKVISNEQANDGKFLTQLVTDSEIDLIILAGYLRKIPVELIEKYSERILNVHPSLLPKYGGKNMYGNHVHRAVFEARDRQSGITFHWVNEHFDKGRIIAQFSTNLENISHPDEIKAKIQALEKEFFPAIVQAIINGTLK